MKHLFVVIFLSVLFCFSAGAQSLRLKDKQWQIKPVINSGFIMVHRATIGHLVKGFPSIYELDISHATSGNKLWQLENNKPDVGLSFQCLDYKNPSQLGYAFSIVPFIDIPLKQEVKNSRLILRLCWGATYITKCFDIHENPKNIAIGSHFNAYVQFKWFWQIQLSKSLRLEPGFAFTHASNGKSKNPNLGLNLASINVGLNYILPNLSKTEITKIDSSTKVKSKNEFLAMAALGFNEKGVETGRLYCLLLSGAYQRNIRNTHKFSLGTDFFCDQVYADDAPPYSPNDPAI
ncbi:MAG: acyloxyacyl hydrolase, partial [Bacteroidota bacterium]